MKRVRDVTTRDIIWDQAEKRTRWYRALLGPDTFATLNFERGSGWPATGEAADGGWSFRRSGSFKPRVVISSRGSTRELATFHQNWKDGGRLEFSNGRTFTWSSTNFWHTAWARTSQSGNTLLRFKGKQMTIEWSGLTAPELPVLAILS